MSSTLPPNGVHATPESTNGWTKDSQSSAKSVAIIGISCKFAGGASSPSKLWDIVAAGNDGWSPIPKTRFDGGSLYHPDPLRTDRHHVKGGYFLHEDVYLFDSAFFNLTGDDANAMDPQLRMLLEASFESLEDAGIPMASLSKSNTSVFTGLFERDYSSLLLKDPEGLPASHMTGNGAAMFSNRLSYFYDLRGPSMTLDTGCSGSMAALHLGWQSLQSGESDLSIVAGTTLHLNPDTFLSYSNLGILGPDGRCHSLDHRFGGYGRGEGTAVLILKSLDSALRDGDNIHAIIRQSAMNHDGRTDTITSPSIDAQRDLIQNCYKMAGLNIAHTPYVEAHLTGTGADCIEANAIAQTFGRSRSPGDAVYLGTVKPNIGHTEALSGLASIVKVTQVLQNQLVPPIAHVEKVNPNIPLVEWNVQFATSLTSWPKGMPLRASVNNFGYGGTNVHMILEAAPQNSRFPKHARIANGTPVASGATEHDISCTGKDMESLVYIVSAKDAKSAAAMGTNLAASLRKTTERSEPPSPMDVAYTLSQRKSIFNWMTAVRASGLNDLVNKLEHPHYKAKRASTSTPSIGFVFNGQGAQWYAMGRELIDTYPVFTSALRRADEILRQAYGAPWSLYDEFLRDEKSTRVQEIALGQLMTVALQLCVVILLRSWGIVPSAVVSHSSGEIAAGYAAGTLSFSEALGIVYYRGKLAEKHQQHSSLQGSMLAVGLSAEEAQTYLDDTPAGNGKAIVACINSPESVTLSGDSMAIQIVLEKLEEGGVFTRKLRVPIAYHSHHMQSMAQEYEDCLAAMLPPVPPTSNVLFASPVTGSIITSPKTLTPNHWVRNLTSPVLFSSALEAMVSNKDTRIDILLEVGAHDTLAGPVRQTIPERKLPYLSCIKRSVNAVHTMQDVACEMLSRGYPVLVGEVNQLTSVSPRPRFFPGLPSYAWNHSTHCEREPRASKEHRHKRFPPHELLGTPVPGCNRRNPIWRNVLRVHDVSWLIDHQLQSQVVLPGAAYVSMAIEAMHFLALESSPRDDISGYLVREIEIINGLSIPSGSPSSASSGGIETAFSLREASEKELDHKGWYEFELWSVTADSTWIKHSAGKVKTIMDSSKPEVNVELLEELSGDVVPIEASQAMEVLRQSDFEFGPAFSNLSGGQVAGDSAIMDFTISPAAFALVDGERPYVLHPTTLDSVFQSCYALLPMEVKDGSMFLPRSVGQLFVPLGLGTRDTVMQTGARVLEIGLQEVLYRGTVAEKGVNGAVLQMHDFRLKRIKSEVARTTDDVCPPHAKLVWEPDVLHDMPIWMKQAMEIHLTDAELDFEQRIRLASYLFIDEAVQKLDGDQDISSRQWYHEKFYQWLKGTVSDNTSGRKSWTQLSPEGREQLYDRLSNENAAGQLTCRIGKQLAEIIRGKIVPLELMMENGLLHQYYQNLPQIKDRSSKHLRRIVELWAVKSPGARVLEIGAGTGGATQHVLDGFATKSWELFHEASRPSLLRHYDFTDISAGFFPAAKEKFAAWQGIMTFSKLDIEADPEQQAFLPGSYDLIIAAQVLHATKNLRRTLKHVRKLLRPGGKLVLLESTQHALDAQMIFGCLPGWWLGEELERQMSPNVDRNAWDAALRDSGFSGIDFDIGECEQAEAQIMSTMVSTAVAESSYPRSITIVYNQRRSPTTWVKDFMDGLEDITGTRPNLASLDAAPAFRGDCMIFLPDIATSSTNDLDAARFDNLKTCLLQTPDVLLLDFGGAVDASGSPLAGQSLGLLRTLRREDSTKRYVYLDLGFDPVEEGLWNSDAIRHILHVFQSSFANDQDAANAGRDWEYAVKESVLYVPRLYPDIALDKFVANEKPPPQLGSYHGCDRNLVWTGIEQDHFSEEQLPRDDALGSMIEIQTKAFGLSAIDTSTRSCTVWHEASGIITRIGDEVAKNHSDLRIGDRVCGMLQGRFAHVSRAPWTHLVKIPTGISWEQAASVPHAFGTANIALHHIARTQPCEHVLVHSAISDVGQAAIRIAQQIGATVFATCTASDERKLLTEQFGIPFDRILSAEHTSFAETVVKQTGGHGIDVALGLSLSAPTLKATWEAMAKLGRLIQIDGNDAHLNNHVGMAPFARGAIMASLSLPQFCERRGHVVRKALLESVKQLGRDQSCFVNPLRIIPLSEVGRELRILQTEKAVGKLIALPQEHEQVLIQQKLPNSSQLDLSRQSACYMIVGGLGGIGFEIASWLIKVGAKNLLVVSRTATSHTRLGALREEAQACGCTLYARDCDISCEKNIAGLAHGLGTDGIPRVRGVIQAAAVLDDSVLERMSYEQWCRATGPKITGTYAIHRHFRDLDFFIMLSSATGILGNVSQSNYTAGNTFQDALARQRTATGLPALSIDLGPVGSVGWISERGEAVRKRVEQALGMKSMTVAHVLRLIESGISDPLRQQPVGSQIVCCIGSYDGLVDDPIVRNDPRVGTLLLGNSIEASNAQQLSDTATMSRLDELVIELNSFRGEEGSDAQRNKAVEVMAEVMAAKLAELFNIDQAEVDADQSLLQHGVDSLVAVGLRSWLGTVLKARVTIFEILQTPTLRDFARLIVERIGLVQ